MYENKPWLKVYEHVPPSLPYPRVTMYEAIRQSAERNADSIAYDFLDYTATYREFIWEIDRCADARMMNRFENLQSTSCEHRRNANQIVRVQPLSG